MPLVDMDWLREYVAIEPTITVEDLSKTLTRLGFEEETIHKSAVEGPIVVGHVLTCDEEPQKNGKLIHWCSIDVGEHNRTPEGDLASSVGVVCGAPNIAAGEWVVVALEGAVLPGDFHIVARKTYGHISQGMCCSEAELGISDQAGGIILLRDYGFSADKLNSLQPGQSAYPLVHLDKELLEINVTPDKGYAFSYRGIAREYHHGTGASFTDPVVAFSNQAQSALRKENLLNDSVYIDDRAPIHNAAGCDHFYLRQLSNIAPNCAPRGTIEIRLREEGIDTRNLASAAADYTMLDLGQPVHVYDADSINLPLVVRRARDGEQMTTKEGKTLTLTTEDLIIADSPYAHSSQQNAINNDSCDIVGDIDTAYGTRVIELAGVCGSQVAVPDENTTNILIQAAHFDPVSVARSARRHKLPTSWSHRFERGCDPHLPAAAVQEVGNLIMDIAGGKFLAPMVDIDNTAAPHIIHFSLSEVNRVTGLNIPARRIISILEDIGCVIKSRDVTSDDLSLLPLHMKGYVDVEVPSWRPDISQGVDLVEEIARIEGYDSIGKRVPSIPVNGSGLNFYQKRRREISTVLAARGLVETLSYPFIGEEDLALVRIDAVPRTMVTIVNPLIDNRPYLRTNILQSLALTLQRNIRRGLENVSLYEIGRVFIQDPNAPAIPGFHGGQRPSDEEIAALNAGLPSQPLHIAGFLTGMSEKPGWYGNNRSIDWTDGVSCADSIAQRVGITFDRLSLSNISSATHKDIEKVLEELGLVKSMWHPGRTAVLLCKDQVVGMAGELHPHVTEKLGIPNHSAAFEIDLTLLFRLLSTAPLKAESISTYPPVKQDLAFMVKKDISSQEVSDIIKKAAGSVLESLDLFDIYTNSTTLSHDEKSLAYSIVLRARDHTLTPEEIKDIRQKIKTDARKIGALLRTNENE